MRKEAISKLAVGVSKVLLKVADFFLIIKMSKVFHGGAMRSKCQKKLYIINEKLTIK